MRKRNLFSKYKVPRLVFFSMTLLCWSMTLVQTAEKQFKTDKAVPAFQNETTPLTEAIPAFQAKNSQTLDLSPVSKQVTRETASSYCQSLAKQIDSDITLLSSHSDAGYSDFYFYSPSLEEQFQIPPITAAGSNLQIVLVWNKNGGCRHIYLGAPCIEYSF